MNEKVAHLVSEISALTLMEAADLAIALREKLGISESQLFSVGGGGANAQEEAKSEKTEFTVVLKSFGSNKLAVIKVLRDKLGLALGEAKTMAESAPVVVKAALDKKSAEELKKTLEEAGAESVLE